MDLLPHDLSKPETRREMRSLASQVRALTLSGVPRVPEQDLAYIDPFVQKGQEPAVVLHKIEQFLNPSQHAA